MLVLTHQPFRPLPLVSAPLVRRPLVRRQQKGSHAASASLAWQAAQPPSVVVGDAQRALV